MRPECKAFLGIIAAKLLDNEMSSWYLYYLTGLTQCAIMHIAFGRVHRKTVNLRTHRKPRLTVYATTTGTD